MRKNTRSDNSIKFKRSLPSTCHIFERKRESIQIRQNQFVNMSNFIFRFM